MNHILFTCIGAIAIITFVALIATRKDEQDHYDRAKDICITLHDCKEFRRLGNLH